MSYSVNNSSIAALGISGTFTGNWEDCLNSRAIHLSLETDQNGTFQIDFSDEPDRGALHTAHHQLNIRANVQENRDLHVLGRYFRVVYTNGGVAQTSFKMYIHLKDSDEVKTTQGYENNLVNNATLNLSTSSSSLDCLNMNKVTVLYEDSSVASVDGLDIEVSNDDSNWWVLASMSPAVVGGVRHSLAQLDVHGLRYIKITNTSAVDNYSNVYCTVTGIN